MIVWCNNTKYFWPVTSILLATPTNISTSAILLYIADFLSFFACSWTTLKRLAKHSLPTLPFVMTLLSFLTSYTLIKSFLSFTNHCLSTFNLSFMNTYYCALLYSLHSRTLHSPHFQNTCTNTHLHNVLPHYIHVHTCIT